MLKTKNIFIVFFVVLALIFGFIFYIFTNSYINFLLINQYKQKIHSLYVVLKFSILDNLNN
ncbi:sensor histidine kinase, partial [Campylobacter jejuni]